MNNQDILEFSSPMNSKSSNTTRNNYKPVIVLPSNSSSITSTTKRNIGFIHVGKTGGATLSLLLRRACLTTKCFHHRQNDPNAIPNETKTSLLTTRYYHCLPPPSSQTTKKKRNRHTSYLISTRNPVDRFVSWYLFRHPDNRPFVGVSNITNSNLRSFFRCWPQVDDLATFGLAATSSISTIDNIKNFLWHKFIRYFGKGVEGENCDLKLAREIVSGQRPQEEADHMHWNYGFYLSDILLNQPEKELLVVRMEHMWLDWQGINTLLGGGTIVPGAKISHIRKSATENISSKNGSSSDIKGSHDNESNQSLTTLPVFNRTISMEGTRNLCCTLKSEIELYLELLRRSTNLNRTEVTESEKEIDVICNLKKIETGTICAF